MWTGETEYHAWLKCQRFGCINYNIAGYEIISGIQSPVQTAGHYFETARRLMEVQRSHISDSIIRVIRTCRISSVDCRRTGNYVQDFTVKDRIEEDVVELVTGIAIIIGAGYCADAGRDTSAVEIAAGVIEIIIADRRCAGCAVDPTALAASTRG